MSRHSMYKKLWDSVPAPYQAWFLEALARNLDNVFGDPGFTDWTNDGITFWDATRAVFGKKGSSEDDSEGTWDAGSATDSLLDDNLWTYLDGLFTSVGAENALNREFNSAEAAANRQFQADEAAKQRQWYEQMSNTAYQRSVNDMRAAGLNPILAVSSGFTGASSSATQVPSGSSASNSTTGGDTIADVLNSFAALIAATGTAASGVGSILKAVLD